VTSESVEDLVLKTGLDFEKVMLKTEIADEQNEISARSKKNITLLIVVQTKNYFFKFVVYRKKI
jgi:hypothetical protein